MKIKEIQLLRHIDFGFKTMEKSMKYCCQHRPMENFVRIPTFSVAKKEINVADAETKESAHHKSTKTANK